MLELDVRTAVETVVCASVIISDVVGNAVVVPMLVGMVMTVLKT